MINSLLKDKDELVSQLPHLSHSRVSRYLHCPEQYRLYYVEKLRPTMPSASLVFGQIVHQALARLFGHRDDPVKCFVEAWTHLNGVKLGYDQKDSWERLRARGEALLTRFVKEELPKLGAIRAVEKVFELNITSMDQPFIGVIDLVTEVKGKPTVVDFKTSGKAYGEHEAALSDQLTAYRLGQPDVEQLALCVLVKTKEPMIEWHFTSRTGTQLTDYLAKVGYVAREISASHFYKRPGMWCAWCDFLPVCLGDTKKVEETLVRIQ
jgi:CRISPR/Cas system-associated exonuclease Cas4 (RecB family)